MDTLLHTPDLAQRLGVSPRTLEHWRLNQQGPPYVRVGRRVVYREGDVAAWLEKHAAGAISTGTPAA